MTHEELGEALNEARRKYDDAKDEAQPFLDALIEAENALEILRAEYKRSLNSLHNDLAQ